MKTIPFNEDWAVRRADLPESRPVQVILPHDAMLSAPRTPSGPGGTNNGWFEAYDYEYLKEFFAPAEWAQQRVLLEFEGIYHRAEVYVNGNRIYAHPNGYFPSRLALDCHLKYGEKNTLRVIARNAQQPNSRWYSGTGIFRPVWLHLLPAEHLLPESIRIQTLDWQTRTVRVSFETSVPGDVTVEILGHRQTGRKQLDFRLPEAEPWSPDQPNLYTARLTFGEDVQEVRFGIRGVEVDAKNGFRLNGKRTLLLGACIHHDNGLLGAAGHPFADRRKIALLKKAGYNAIRSAHNPVSRAILDACDELGMLVVDEYADMWYMHKTRYDYADLFEKNWKTDLPLLVEKDRNHPSVVMYSIGNEVCETARPKGIALAGEMCSLLHALDDRPVTCGINIFFNFLSSLGFGVYSDRKAKKAAENGGRGRRKAMGSEFINNVAGLLGAGFMKFGATLHGSDATTRDAFAHLDVAGYNYGIGRYKKDLKKYPDRVILGSETFVSDAAAFYDLAVAHPALIGDFVWAGMDYLGEVGLGAWEYKSYAPTFDHGPGWITSGSGTLDLIGTETCQMAYTRAVFGLSPVRIGVVPVPFAREKHSPAVWRFTNAVESWSWNGCDGRETDVEVYARGAETELLLNGKSLFRKKIPKDLRTRFRVPYAAGVLTAVVYDGEGRETARTSLQTAGEETRLTLLPETQRVPKDGLLYVRLRYTDQNGIVKPLESGPIRVSVSGGTLLALGHACPYNEAGYLSDTTDTYYGEAMAIVKPGSAHGVTVRASSPCGEAEVTLPADQK